MSKFTEILDQTYSRSVDAAIAVAAGAVAYVLFQAVPNILPFQEAAETAGAGVIAAMTYLRARN